MSISVGINLPGVGVGVTIGGNSNSEDWPHMPGNSKADDSMAYYVANGFNTGSIADREKARLAAQAAEPPTTKKSIFDLYQQLSISNSGKRVR
jgi:hypothetical protein